MNIVGILLAAGAGSRFGGGKLAHPIPPDGLPLSLVAYRNLKSVLDTVIVVVRADDATVRSIFEDEGARLALCPDAREGMGRSLAAGIDAATDADGWVIALGDMPKVAPQTIRRVAAALEAGASIAAPVHEGRRGHPVGFSSAHRLALTGLRGDQGARNVLTTCADQIRPVPVEDPGIHTDIDTREDAARL
ncbi:MAG: nucleotidyltransferase family protein [Burkholderiales bacterium]